MCCQCSLLLTFIMHHLSTHFEYLMHMIGFQHTFLKSTQCMRDLFEKWSFEAEDKQIQCEDNMHNYCCQHLLPS